MIGEPLPCCGSTRVDDRTGQALHAASCDEPARFEIERARALLRPGFAKRIEQEEETRT